MRTKLLLVLLVALVALTVFVTTAAAAPGPRLRGLTITTPAEPIPAAAVVPKTAAMLGGSAYPWVQPVWQSLDGVVIVKLPQTIVTAYTQPSAWVLAR
jgi:hypothetical protein